LEEREEEREEKWTLMQEPALARAPRHFERVKGGPCIDKVVLLYTTGPKLYADGLKPSA
jgi:hypothetical protein